MAASIKGKKNSLLKLAVKIQSQLKAHAKGVDSKKLEKRIEKYSIDLAERIEKLKKDSSKKSKKDLAKKKKAVKTTGPSQTEAA